MTAEPYKDLDAFIEATMARVRGQGAGDSVPTPPSLQTPARPHGAPC